MFPGNCRLNDIKYMVSLLHYGSFLGLNPRYSAVQQNFILKTKRRYLSYAWIVLIAIVYFRALSMQIDVLYSHIATEFTVIMVTTEVISVTTAITCISFGSLRSLDCWRKLWRSLKMLDAYLNNRGDGLSKCAYYLEIAVTSTVMSLRIVYATFRIISNRNQIILQILYPTIEFIIFSWLLIFFNFVRSLKIRFRSFNKLVGGNELIALTGAECKYVKRIYFHLAESFNALNQIFSWSLFMIITYAMTTVFFAVTIVLETHSSDMMEVICAVFNLVLSAIMQLSVLIITCGNASTEINRTPCVLSNLMVKIQRNGARKDVVKDLFHVLKVSQTKLDFSAAGFFVVGNALAISLITTTTSFTIALIILLN